MHRGETASTTTTTACWILVLPPTPVWMASTRSAACLPPPTAFPRQPQWRTSLWAPQPEFLRSHSIWHPQPKSTQVRFRRAKQVAGLIAGSYWHVSRSLVCLVFPLWSKSHVDSKLPSGVNVSMCLSRRVRPALSSDGCRGEVAAGFRTFRHMHCDNYEAITYIYSLKSRCPH